MSLWEGANVLLATSVQNQSGQTIKCGAVGPLPELEEQQEPSNDIATPMDLDDENNDSHKTKDTVVTGALDRLESVDEDQLDETGFSSDTLALSDAANGALPPEQQQPQSTIVSTATIDRRRRARQNQETVEAALNRLSKAYHAAMECLAALHRADAAAGSTRQPMSDSTQAPTALSPYQLAAGESEASMLMGIEGVINRNKQEKVGQERERVDSLRHVAMTARIAFERAILLDPLVAEHTPALENLLMVWAKSSIEQQCANDKNSDADGSNLQSQHPWWNDDAVVWTKDRPDPPTLTSTGHKETIRQLAYLSLVNYADLLLSGCSCDCTQGTEKISLTILDRGVVRKLKSFSEPFQCCWKIVREADDSTEAMPKTDSGENIIDLLETVNADEYRKNNTQQINETEEDTVRLALVSYLDASVLDDSDPTLWLKMACAARRLGRIKAQSETDGFLRPPSLFKYRRLERHALEQARTALPPHEPPNRTVLRAMEELENEDDPSEYPPVLAADEEPYVLDLHLTRYSWSFLVRILLRACREGSDFIPDFKIPPFTKPAPFLGSPNICLHLSPLLSMPIGALGKLCQHLNTNSMINLNATCKVLSSTVHLARKFAVDQDLKWRAVENQEAHVSMHATEQAEVEVDTIAVDKEGSNSKVNIPTPTAKDKKVAREQSLAIRASKRLRSQMITSGKREERSSRRRSIDYCFLSATLNCTAQDEWYQKSVRDMSIPNSLESTLRQSSDMCQSQKESENSFVLGKREADTRGGDASLLSFVKRWTAREASPLAVLFGLAAHASLNLDEVFAIDADATGLLETCLVECFDFLSKRTHSPHNLMPSWLENETAVPAEACLSPIDLFAIDLLHAELRFKRCEYAEIIDADFDGDCNVVYLMVPHLMDSMEDLEKHVSGHQQTKWAMLRARCTWLAAGYFLWRGKLCNNISDSREAEGESLAYIEKTIVCLDSPREKPMKILRTPHLGSTKRDGLCWNELSVMSLKALRDEIQASSVVLQAQEQFLEATSQIAKSHDSESLLQSHKDVLFSIGTTLLQRYQSGIDSPDSKYVELIDDFVASKGDDLLAQALPDDNNTRSAWFNQWCPSMCVSREHLLTMPSPPILSILVICILCKGEDGDDRLNVAILLARLIITIQKRLKQTGKEMKHEREIIEKSLLCGDTGSREAWIPSAKSTQRYPLQMRYRLYCRLVHFLVDKVHDILCGEAMDAAKLQFFESEEFQRIMKNSICLIAESSIILNGEDLKEVESLCVLLSVQSLFRSIYDSCVPVDVQQDMTRIHLIDIGRFIVELQKSLSSIVNGQSDRHERATRHKICCKRSEFLSAICCHLGLILSHHLIRADAGHLRRSELYNGAMRYGNELNELLAPLSESLLWLWKTASRKDDVLLDRASRNRLRVPVALAMIALCGTSASTKECKHSGDNDFNNQVCLEEFFDSDDSATEWLDDEGKNCRLDNFLCVMSSAVYFMGYIVEGLEENEMASYSYFKDYVTKNGPLLPLLLTRVLNLFADRLLLDFQSEEEEQNDEDQFTEKKMNKSLWSSYSIGTRKVGFKLDCILHKAYKSLHGFTLVNSADGKETPSGHVSGEDVGAKRFPPENAKAAAQLYRCIVRAYSRKSPPKSALETVLSALPPIEESQRSKVIQRYLFSPSPDYLSIRKLLALVTKRSTWSEDFSDMHAWDMCDGSRDGYHDSFDDECIVVRRGISSLIAQGPIPTYQDSAADARLSTAHVEQEISKKFGAIIYGLSYGNTADCEGWYKASQCLVTKADLIADRVGLSTGFARSKNFCVKGRNRIQGKSLSLSDLLSTQEKEAALKEQGWVHSLGNDLSLFIRQSWSSFESLKQLSSEVGKGYGSLLNEKQVEDRHDLFEAHTWKGIEALLQEENYVGWQEAWGGLFVSSLRQIAVRCMSFAIYILHRRGCETVSDKVLLSEIVESMGTTLYTELMASQVYGYPMHIMPPKRKRELAEAALACFTRSVQLVRESCDDESDTDNSTWDLLFMIGKCHEKIASTYQSEKLVPLANNVPRLYEHHMSKSLHSYAEAFKEAEKANKEGGAIVEQQGGSSHGASEFFYRLHASRLKCLIAAVDRQTDERNLAEEEGLRLTERHWHVEPEENFSSGHIRDRVWNVLTDVVAALAQCRIDHAYFHRSVYRHAQALMWAPVLCDPIGERAAGSVGTVPATRAFKLRGLNYATNAAHSGAVVIGSLFEKKRAQLCAVWVTSSSNVSPFQTINNTVRKYDSLRGKYISAYIDSLQLCNRKTELETFLRWVASAQRDLPSYFAASAALQGGVPEKSHSQDCLLVRRRSLASHFFLTTVKRQMNGALAAVILHDLKHAMPTTNEASFLEEQLKTAYACFMRLRCQPSDLLKTKSHLRERSVGEVVKALTVVYLTMNPTAGQGMDWSGQGRISDLLEASLKKCRELFPNMSGKQQIKKRVAPAEKSKKNAGEVEDSSLNKTAGKKRTKLSDGLVKRSFEVSVPKGLKPGDTFLSSVRINERQTKKVRLTVPGRNPSTLRFTLRLPAEEDANSSENMESSSHLKNQEGETSIAGAGRDEDGSFHERTENSGDEKAKKEDENNQDDDTDHSDEKNEQSAEKDDRMEEG